MLRQCEREDAHERVIYDIKTQPHLGYQFSLFVLGAMGVTEK